MQRHASRRIGSAEWQDWQFFFGDHGTDRHCQVTAPLTARGGRLVADTLEVDEFPARLAAPLEEES
jgi:hypothetical protein